MSTADNVVRKAVTNLIASDDDLTTYNLEVSLPQNLTRLQGVTNITHIEEIPELVKHHNTLVRFDCVITDMFDEEFFVSTLLGSSLLASYTLTSITASLTAFSAIRPSQLLKTR